MKILTFVRNKQSVSLDHVKQVKKSKGYRCFDCRYKAPTYKLLVQHYLSFHKDDIPDGMHVEEYIFRRKNKNRTVGRCVVCRKPTKFNLQTKKFSRTCGRQSCKDKLSQTFQQNVKAKTGKTHQEIMKDPEEQKRRLMNRTISGVIKYKNKEYNYTGSYEKDFIESAISSKWFDLDLLVWSPPWIRLKYVDKDGVERSYIPDFYLRAPYNLIIEIKDGGDNPNKHYAERDRDKELLKDLAVIDAGKWNYCKIVNKEYDLFLELLNTLAENNTFEDEFKPIYVIPK